MKVSFIVPIYNREDSLEICVKSILEQTYTDFEVLLIDDGSIDCSLKICNELSIKDNRIKVYHKSNGGLSDARNYGLSRAEGDFVCFVDSDDVLDKNFLNILVNKQKEFSADIVSCGIKKIYSYKEIPSFNTMKEIKYFVKKNNDCIKEYLCQNENTKIGHSVANKLFRKELLNNIEFPVGRLHEDLHTTYKLIEKCKCLVVVDSSLYYYYKNNPNSICTNYNKRNLVDQCHALKEMDEYLSGNSSIYKELMFFETYMYLDLYKLSYRVEDDIKDIRKQIKNNVLEKANKCNILTNTDKLKIYIKLLLGGK